MGHFVWKLMERRGNFVIVGRLRAIRLRLACRARALVIMAKEKTLAAILKIGIVPIVRANSGRIPGYRAAFALAVASLVCWLLLSSRWLVRRARAERQPLLGAELARLSRGQ